MQQVEMGDSVIMYDSVINFTNMPNLCYKPVFTADNTIEATML